MYEISKIYMIVTIIVKSYSTAYFNNTQRLPKEYCLCVFNVCDNIGRYLPNKNLYSIIIETYNIGCYSSSKKLRL